MLKPNLVFDCPVIVKDNVTENARPVLLPPASWILLDTRIPELPVPYDWKKFEINLSLIHI